MLTAGGFVPGEDFVVDGIRHVEVLPHLVRIAAPSEVRMIFLKADAALRSIRVAERSAKVREDFDRAATHVVEADMEDELPMVTMNGDTQIYVSGREYKVPGNVVSFVSYEQVVKIYNKLHEAENKHIIGTPGIAYENSLKGEDGILMPGKDVAVKDGTSFSVDPEHVS